ncbi:hypothetical protein J31TS4_32170 [Paenibacillus sp. J31TS4]|uniref:NAD(P)-dependent oxidoreductase n=1 Tax=Paenibacillus sp. J31TS4 TaxID=2807195 RepID=UPI001B20AB57|nr:NAD(P)-dependent oxidoreductase [Paenibacillus sp. J31TS4]GIP39937.1 hypothetical protein J31TS4_32170 [Paenibacillus sp. J31TS4]
MKIAIIGASGKAGRLIAEEALRRGHQVTGLVRDASKAEGLPVLEKDIFSLTSDDLKPFDAVINAFGAAPGQEHLHVEAGRHLIEAMKGASGTRLLVVGGAGSLFADEAQSVRVLDTPGFPREYYATAANQAQNLEDLLQSSGFAWTFLSPSAFFDPQGPRTGAYRAGGNNLLVNSEGNSYISYADFAIAVLDELEHPQHVNERFTVVGEAR